MLPARILVNEDSPLDFRLLREELQRSEGEWDIRHVHTREALARALTEFSPDLIISDYYLEVFNALDVLEIVKAQAPGTPVIILTNALNEEIAVECMKRGATDYVLKNRLPRMVTIVENLLERQRLVREKRRLEMEHEQLFQLTPNLYCVAALDGILHEVNPAWKTRLDYERADLIGRPLVTLVHPDDRHALTAWWRQLAATPAGPPLGSAARLAECECRLVHKHEGFRHLLWNATPLPSEGRVYAYGHDITERKRAEVALRESEARFRALADSAPVLIWIADAARNCHYFNAPWLRFTGRPLERELGDGWIGGIHPEDTARCLQTYEEGFASRQPFRVEYRLRRHDGSYRWILNHGTPRYDEHGVFLGYIGSCIDINDQHEVEARLAQRAIRQAALASFGRFALAQHAFSELIHEAARLLATTLLVERCQVLALQPDGTTLVLAAAVGFEAGALHAPFCQTATAAVEDHAYTLGEHPDLFPGADKLVDRGVRAGLAVPVGAGKRAYGFLTVLSDQPMVFTREIVDFVHGVASILSTMHQRERAEAALEESEQNLLQSQKMEAVGILAGGVAHDFNNLLTAVRCYADILHDDLAQAAPASQPKVTEILRATTRASALVRQLLAFSRKQILQPEFLDLNAVVADLKDLVRSLLSENIAVELRLTEQPVYFEADRSQIEQVLINLCINARDAMPTGGVLTLETRFRMVSPGQTQDLEPGDYVELAVKDTGVGMSAEVQKQLFQPFFTTKPKGRGTGLGLATCVVIVKNCGGSIFFESEVGAGTTFRVLLPHINALALTTDFDTEKELREGSESVLLVEDDESIRAVTLTILESLGYRVVAVPGSAEALELCRSPHAPAFDLLLSDIVMPHLGGRELAERLTALQPDLKTLFMSGYVDDAVILRAMQDASFPFLEKPFTRGTLAKKVREALDQSNGRK